MSNTIGTTQSCGFAVVEAVGMRLREANVRESTVSDILWHQHRTMTGHYSVAQIEELVSALDVIADEHGRANKTLQMLQLEARKQGVA